MDAGELVPDDIMIGVVDERLASTTTPSPRLHARRLPPHGGPGRGARRVITRAPARRRRQPRGAARGRARAPRRRRVCVDCGANYSRRRAADARLDLRRLRRRGRPARRRHRGGDRPCASSSTTRETVPLIDFYREQGMLVDGRRRRARPTRCTDAADRGDRRPRRRPSVRSRRDGVAAVRAPDQIAMMRRAGRVVAEMHESHPRRRSARASRPPTSTRIGREVLERRGARSNFLGYHGFPAVICTSPNDVIVHGIPGRAACSRRATSSRSTAAPSSRAGTATPRSPSPSASRRRGASG